MSLDNLQNHWEKVHSGEETVFSSEPNKIVIDSLQYLSGGKVLDLGAGDGGDSLFLAEKGFDVTAVDISTSAIKKINKFANEKRLKMKTIVGDLTALESEEEKDLILMIRILHILDRNEALETIKKVQKVTRVGGLNVIDVVTKESDFYKSSQENESLANRFFTSEEDFKNLYDGWEVLASKSRKWDAKLKTWPDGSPMTNTSQEFIFKKTV